MEEEHNGRQPKWKTTTMEDNKNGRQTQWKIISMKVTSIEDDLHRG